MLCNLNDCFKQTLKKGWVLMGSASARPLPSRWEICLFSSFLRSKKM